MYLSCIAMNLPINNPAERLLAILKDLSERRNTNTRSSLQENLTQIIGMNNDSESFYQAIFEISQIIYHIENEIMNFPPAKKQSFTKILSIVKKDIFELIPIKDNKWNSSVPCNNPIGYSNYQVLDWLPVLAADYEEYKCGLTEEELTNFRDELLNLIKSVEESSIEENFKKILLVKLKEILNAVNDFYIYGIKGLNKEMLSALFDLSQLGMSQGDDEYNILKNSIVNFLWNKLSDTFSKVNPVISGVVNTYKFTEIVSKLLPPGDSQ